MHFLWCLRQLLKTLGLTLKMRLLPLRYASFEFIILLHTSNVIVCKCSYKVEDILSLIILLLNGFFQGDHDRGNVVGLNLNTGEPIDPQMEGIFDNYSVKRQIINSGYGSILTII